MVIDMNDAQLQTIDQVRSFLQGAAVIQFQPCGNAEDRYVFIQGALQRFRYGYLGRADKGVVRRYLTCLTGYSRQQLTRLVRQCLSEGRLTRRHRPPLKGFVRKFTAQDVTLLAETDTLHGTLSGPATKRLMQRAFEVFGDTRYARLATISVAHLYNLRHQTSYQTQRRHWTKTRGTPVAIGERRPPAPNGRPGFIRIDSVHQGDQDGIKGVYHINAVDGITQWQLVATCERISEAYLLPVLAELLNGFPFQILGFHADNGSEYINGRVAALLTKLHVELTKSRPRHSNDNALAETKNGAVVRKHLGYAHIPQRFASQVNTFCHDHLNPYVNFHRPCFFPVETVDAKGKIKKHYPYDNLMTPYDKLRSLPDAQAFLKPGITFEQLDQQAYQLSDNEAAKQLNEARYQLFQSIFNRPKSVA